MRHLFNKFLTHSIWIVPLLGTTTLLALSSSCALQKPRNLENHKSSPFAGSDEGDLPKSPIMPLTALDQKNRSLTLERSSRVIFTVRWNGGRLPQTENPTLKFYRKGETTPFLTTTWADLECTTGSLLPKSADMDSVTVCSKILGPLADIVKIEALSEKEGIVRTASGLAPVAINNDDAELLALFY